MYFSILEKTENLLTLIGKFLVKLAGGWKKHNNNATDKSWLVFFNSYNNENVLLFFTKSEMAV